MLRLGHDRVLAIDVTKDHRFQVQKSDDEGMDHSCSRSIRLTCMSRRARVSAARRRTRSDLLSHGNCRRLVGSRAVVDDGSNTSKAEQSSISQYVNIPISINELLLALSGQIAEKIMEGIGNAIHSNECLLFLLNQCLPHRIP